MDRVIGHDRLPKLEDREQLPYFWAVLKEVTSERASGRACERVDEVRLLAWFLPLRPKLVTIARSVDGFLPFHCTARIEAAVLRVLAAAAASFNASLKVEHLPGTATGAALQAMTDGLGARARAGGVQ